jgi:general secretion pathway protein J
MNKVALNKTLLRAEHGFTLIEIMIALFIFAIMGLMIAVGLRTVLTDQAVTNRASDQLAQLQLAISIVDRDLTQITNRNITDENGKALTAMVTDSNATSLELTHAGYVNPLWMNQRSTLQRVRYVLDNDQFIRQSWRSLDRTGNTLMDTQVLLTGVIALNFQFLNKNKQWQNTIPMPSMTTDSDLPFAVRISLDTRTMGHVERVIPLATPMAEVLNVKI